MRRAASILLLALGCVSPVSSGLPALTDGCRTAADCGVAGPAYQCVDGGCAIVGCRCDTDCADAGLLCYAGTLGNQCLAVDGGTPCDGGI